MYTIYQARVKVYGLWRIFIILIIYIRHIHTICYDSLSRIIRLSFVYRSHFEVSLSTQVVRVTCLCIFVSLI